MQRRDLLDNGRRISCFDLERKKEKDRKRWTYVSRWIYRLAKSRFAILVARGGTRPGYFYTSSLQENGIMYFGSSLTGWSYQASCEERNLDFTIVVFFSFSDVNILTIKNKKDSYIGERKDRLNFLKTIRHLSSKNNKRILYNIFNNCYLSFLVWQKNRDSNLSNLQRFINDSHVTLLRKRREGE